MSLARIFIIRLRETPKYLLTNGRDAEVVEILQGLAKSHNKSCSLTLEQLEACGELMGSENMGGGWKSKLNIRELLVHVRGLFLTKKMGISTGLIWFSWSLIGLAYPLYNVRFCGPVSRLRVCPSIERSWLK